MQKSHDNKLKFYIVCDSPRYEANDDICHNGIIMLYTEHKDISEHEYELSAESDDRPEGYEHYGKSMGLYWIWKNCKSDYIGFSLCDKFPDISEKALTDAIDKNEKIIITEKISLPHDIRTEYKERYYDYDIKTLCDYIKDYLPTMHECNENLISSNALYLPIMIMRKDIYRKFCAWLFQVLGAINSDLKPKVSTMQNKYLEHLAGYLINLYILYYYKKLSPISITSLLEIRPIKPKIQTSINKGGLTQIIQEYINSGEVETAISFLSEHADNESYEKLNSIFKTYIREKRHYSQTHLDRNPNIRQLFEDNDSSEVLTHKPKALVIVWNSFNIKTLIHAISNMGFYCDTLYIGSADENRHKDKSDKVMEFLDSHEYDYVVSTNYFDYISEACYVHGIPYFAWTYDSPADMGNLELVKYDTTYVFMFDSIEVESYRKRGYSNIYYLPLAVDTEEFNAIHLTEGDIAKYKSQISFVGQLYTSLLTDYLNYLPDYKKGFMNALLDYNTFRYDTTIVEDIFSKDLSDWLSEKAFVEKVLKNEKTDKDISHGALPIYMLQSRIGTLTLKTITNRERVLLISMLSNHWRLKLYSNSTHEIFKNTIECGMVDYGSEMPKVFKATDINLNSTVRYIRSGIPLRCLDIMGCGGFLLTNYQRDLDNDFRDGENIAIFNSLEEAYDKCRFYLDNDSERQRIAQNGYDTVKELYSFNRQIMQMLKTANLSHLINAI